MLRRRLTATSVVTASSMLRCGFRPLDLFASVSANRRFDSSSAPQSSGGGCPMSGGAKASSTASSSGTCPMSGMTKSSGGGCPAEDDQAPHQLSNKEIVHQMGKFRLSAFVSSTASAGYILCGGVNPLTLVAVTAGTYLMSLSANTANQCIEVEYDRMMKRTSKRPLVVGAITKMQAVQLSAAELAIGTGMLAAISTPAMLLGVANWFMYVCVYTPLKRLSTTNTWWGSIVGAIPPLMGGVCATGGVLAITNPVIQPAYLLGGLMFAWQIPHFMSLAFFCRRDYEAAGFKMLPFNNPTRASVYAVTLSIVMAAITTVGLPYGSMPVESWFLVLSTVANTVMCYKAWMFHQDPVKYCRSCFVFSYMYLAVMIVLLCVNHAQPVAFSQRLYKRYYLGDSAVDEQAAAAVAELPLELVTVGTAKGGRSSSQ